MSDEIISTVVGPCILLGVEVVALVVLLVLFALDGRKEHTNSSAPTRKWNYRTTPRRRGATDHTGEVTPENPAMFPWEG